jgi:hypothetical protein
MKKNYIPSPTPAPTPTPTPAPAPTPAPTLFSSFTPTPAPNKHFLDKYSPTCSEMFGK